MPSLRPLRRRESRTAGFVFGRFWAADSVPLRIVPDCSAAPASEPAAIPVRSSVIPARPVALPFRGFPVCSAAGPAAVVPAALSAALLAPAVVPAVRPVPSAGTAATGNSDNAPARIAAYRFPLLFISADFRFSNVEVTNFSANSSLSAPKLPVLLSACPASGVCPDRLFSYICPEKKR